MFCKREVGFIKVSEFARIKRQEFVYKYTLNDLRGYVIIKSTIIVVL